MIVHSTALDVAVTAARLSALPSNRIIVLDDHLPSSSRPKRWTVPGLIRLGSKEDRGPVERTFSAGEGKSKIALLCWSSGTTGKPKVVTFACNPYPRFAEISIIRRCPYPIMLLLPTSFRWRPTIRWKGHLSSGMVGPIGLEMSL